MRLQTRDESIEDFNPLDPDHVRKFRKIIDRRRKEREAAENIKTAKEVGLFSYLLGSWDGRK